eukprot:g29236.t2
MPSQLDWGPRMAEMGASQGRGQEEDVGHWLTEVTGGKNHLKFYRNLQVGASKKKEVPQGVKAELDGAIVAEGEGDELPQLQAIVECKWGLSMYGDLQKMDALLHFLYDAWPDAWDRPRSRKSLKLQLPKGLEVKYFMGHLPDGEGEGDSLDRLLRPSALRQEKGRLLSSTFSPGCAARASMELVDFQGPWAVLVELPEDEVALLYRFGQVLAHPCNLGYHNLSNLILSRFAGQQLKNLAELARAVSRCEEEQLVFHFQRPHGDGGELVVLDRHEAHDAEAEILAQHLIGAPCMVRCDGQGEPRPLDEVPEVPVGQVREDAGNRSEGQW